MWWVVPKRRRKARSRPPSHLIAASSEIQHQNDENEKLDQVYCAWLIKWWIISGTWWYWVSIWRYWLVLGQYKLVLLDIRWYMVSKGLVCLYILEKVEIWSGVTDAWHTHSLTDRNTRLKALLWAGNPSYMGHHTSHHHFYSIFIPHFSQPSIFAICWPNFASY